MAFSLDCQHIKRRYGMEVCTHCDYDTCQQCGERYIRRDMPNSDICYPCMQIPGIRAALDKALRAQAERQTRNGVATQTA